MRITSIEHVYNVDGTEKEVREYASELRQKYKEVSVYPTPFNDRIVCTGCKGHHDSTNAILSCDMCALDIDKM